MNIAAIFDLHPLTRNDGRTTYVLRATRPELDEARSHWNAMEFYRQRFTMHSGATRRSADAWLDLCNRIVDLHWQRKPLARTGP